MCVGGCCDCRGCLLLLVTAITRIALRTSRPSTRWSHFGSTRAMAGCAAVWVVVADLCRAVAVQSCACLNRCLGCTRALPCRVSVTAQDICAPETSIGDRE